MIKYEDENFYRAIDGKPFNTEEECKAYEMDAGGIGDKVREHMLAKTNELEMKECMAAYTSGIEEYEVEIYKPETTEEINMINDYLDFYNVNLSFKDKLHISDSFIGKYIIVKFDVGRRGAFAQTPEVIHTLFMNALEELISKGDK